MDRFDPDELVGRLLTVEVEGRTDGMFTDNEDQHVLSDPRWVNDFLEQDALWQDRSGTFLEIESMDAHHAQSCIGLMLRTAPGIALAASLQAPAVNDTEHDSEVWKDRVVDVVAARRWLIEMPLVQALFARASTSSVDIPPWENRAVIRRVRRLR